MAENCTCNTEVTYTKAIPSEIINIGDVIMLDPDTGYIKRAVLNNPLDYDINNRLVVGICVWSDNTSLLQKIIDGGKSKDITRQILNGGTLEQDVQTIVILGGSSQRNTREIIKIVYTGEQLVNLCGPVCVGDRLYISNRPGLAKPVDYHFIIHRDLRTIGTVTEYEEGSKQANVLLDIE